MTIMMSKFHAARCWWRWRSWRDKSASPAQPLGFLHQRLAGLDHGLNLLGLASPVRFWDFQRAR